MDHISNINQIAKDNNSFRQVLSTGLNSQVVVMSIEPGEDIGTEVHNENDQVLYLVFGKGTVVLNGVESDYSQGDLVLVRAGIEHNFIAGDEGMKIVTTYSPPHHADGTIHETKADAEAAEHQE